MEYTFKGLMAPVFATYNYDSTKSLNLKIIPEYAQFLKKAGIEGLLVNGTSGEGMSMNAVERKCIAEAWVLAAKASHQNVMIQVGGAPLPDVLEMAQHAEQIGANSILCLPDLYNKPQNASQLINYLKIVSRAAPKTPLLYYHIPMFTNVNINMGVFLQEMGKQIPTFVGIKFTSNILDEGVEALNAHNGKFTIFLGADTLMLGAYSMGFTSAIATTLNMYPEIGVNILKSSKDNKLETARMHQKNLSKLVSVITKYGNWVPSMKAAMNIVSPFDCGPVRDPMINLTDNQIKNLKNDLENLK